ncbi:hypothetical protein IQ13_1378 [Lacibacter cauensis]|uniref:Uncharacterized protein n=1 Tax=Lacibacter cauensis TaxID=510947 RepID=A0A562SR65_9BACT|nr:hypothetical protein [Lacibacter cauensis]TWI83270.1 hypothetical protein IQ13_1378 [Lacibacter cauensis]
MTYLPQHIWADIAATQELKTDWAKRMFTISEGLIDEEIDRQAAFFSSLGFTNKIVLAFLQFMPLLLEQKAISSYINNKELPELRSVLPEIQDAGEAVLYVKNEHILSDYETKALYCLFKAIENSQMIS